MFFFFQSDGTSGPKTISVSKMKQNIFSSKLVRFGPSGLNKTAWKQLMFVTKHRCCFLPNRLGGTPEEKGSQPPHKSSSQLDG